MRIAHKKWLIGLVFLVVFVTSCVSPQPVTVDELVASSGHYKGERVDVTGIATLTDTDHSTHYSISYKMELHDSTFTYQFRSPQTGAAVELVEKVQGNITNALHPPASQIVTSGATKVTGEWKCDGSSCHLEVKHKRSSQPD